MVPGKKRGGSKACSARLALFVSALVGAFGPSACVETGGSNKNSSGGSRAVGNGGDSTTVGGDTSSAAGGCSGTIDTATDGTAGTTSTGPYTWKSVTIRGGGFVDGIIFSTKKQGVVFARTDMGGAYRFDTAMNGWVPLTDWVDRTNSNQIGIESIAADPNDANIVYMAAGTYLTSGNGVILRSTDGGASFVSNPIGVPMGGNSDGRSMGERLAIDPKQTSTLYFGSRTMGLMRSTDSGSNWSQVTSFPVLGGKSSGGTQLGLSFVLFDPRNVTASGASSTIYVGVADVTAGSNLYVSNDAGATWQLVAGGPTAQMPHHAVLDSDGRLYLAYNNGPGPNNITAGGIWKYDTTTGQWTDISPVVSGNHGFGGITLDANNSGTLIVSTLDWWAPDEIFRTTNAGANWTPIGKGAQHNPNGAEWLRWGVACATPSYGGWMGDIEIDPYDSNHVLYVTGQGIWSNNNVTASNVSERPWTFTDRNLEQTAVTDMVPSVNGAFLSCVGDIAGMRSENLDQPSPTGMYNNPIFGNCTSLDFAAKDTNIVVRAGNPTSANPGKYGAYSKDNGKTWTPFASQPVAGATCSSGGKLALSADGTNIIWTLRCTVPAAPDAGTATIQVTTIAVSSDFGGTWTPVTGLPTGASIAADRENPNKFYAYLFANGAGTVYASTDGGKTFAATTNTVSFVGRGTIRSVFGVEGDTWIVASSNTASALYHSTESGANFVQLSNLQAAYAVGFGKATDGKTTPTVYLFGQSNGILGFFRSDDQGATWTRINDDQHQFGTAGYIAGDENKFGRVYIGTNGRGILYGDPN